MTYWKLKVIESRGVYGSARSGPTKWLKATWATGYTHLLAYRMCALYVNVCQSRPVIHKRMDLSTNQDVRIIVM